jgi:hypothetical protein
MPKRAGRKSLAQTPAPKKERIIGSKVNPKGSAASESSAKNIKFDAKTLTALVSKLKEFKEKHPNNKNITLADLKAVYRRGAGAYSSSFRPTITGGRPNSRNAWAMARVNKFLLKAGGTKVKKAYVQDDDLMKYVKGGLIAPNGRKSNLTPEQYKLVRTPEFKAWFGDWENDPESASKVVDENGEPLVVYRGMPKKRRVGNVFKYNVNLFGNEGVGGRQTNYFAFYFTDMKEVAEAYGENLTEEGEEYVIKPYFLNIRKLFKAFDFRNQYEITLKNLYDLANESGEKIYYKNHKGEFETDYDGNKIEYINHRVEFARKYNEKYPQKQPTFSYFVDWTKNDSNQYFWSNYLKYQIGYNGVVFYEISYNTKYYEFFEERNLLPKYGLEYSKTYGVFEPNDIKLADGTNTTFDSENLDIRYEDGGEVDENKETYKKWKSLVNMSKSELENFYNSQEGKDAGLSASEARSQGIDSGRESARWIMRMKDTPVSEWNPTMWKWAKKQISFISRMSGNKGSLYDDKGKKTRKHTSLLIWGHNPEKKLFGGIMDKGGLISPNGKPSNLTPEQYKLVRTPEFKTWFGDWENDPENASKVVDENGEPLVVYHGTGSDFNIFKVGKTRGIMFTDKKSSAELFSEGYLKREGLKPHIKDCFLNIKKPFYKGITKDKTLEKDYWNEYFNNRPFISKKSQNSILSKQDKFSNEIVFFGILNEDGKKKIIEYNYDGVVFDADNNAKTYVAFYPEQIKLADGTNTTFDGGNPDIRFKDGGLVTEDKIEVFGLDNYTTSKKSGKFYHIYAKRKIGDELDENWWIRFSVKDGENNLYYIDYNIRNTNPDKEIYYPTKKLTLSELPKSLLDIYNNPDIRFEDGGLLAPNGKPSNLTLEQYKLVRTPEFKAWFGDWENDPKNASKVVDENGEPLVVYHGSNNNSINVFNVDKSGTVQYSDWGKGIYFTPSKSTADYYSNEALKKINKDYNDAYELYEKTKSWDDLKKFQSIGMMLSKNENTIVYEVFLNIRKPLVEVVDSLNYTDPYLSTTAIENKKDGVFIKKRNGRFDEILAFEPTQIKLADGTNTTFDSSNPDIRYNEGGSIKNNAFKNWFNNSKVVDKRGNPLIVYHGSPDLRGLKSDYIFKTINEKFGNEVKDRAYFFTDSYSMAKSYADPKRAFDYQNAEEGIVPLYLSLQNPYIIDAGNQIWRKFETEINGEKIIGTRNLILYAQSNNYDGVIVKNVRDYYSGNEKVKSGGNVYVAFHPEQIKLADGTNTTFDGNNPDIRYARGGYFKSNKTIEQIAKEKNVPLSYAKKQLEIGMKVESEHSNFKHIQKKIALQHLDESINYYEKLNEMEQQYMRDGGTLKYDSKGVKDYFAHSSGSAGGVLVGKRHSEGGIKAINKSTGQPLEMEGGEVVITRKAVSDETKREFEGEMLTNKEILSKINESGGGVKIFGEGGNVENETCSCSGKSYKYGGKMMSDYDIAKQMARNDKQEYYRSLFDKSYEDGGKLDINDLNPTEMYVLGKLDRNIHSICEIDRSKLSQISELVRKGFIYTVHKKNSDCHEVRLTDYGMSVLKSIEIPEGYFAKGGLMADCGCKHKSYRDGGSLGETKKYFKGLDYEYKNQFELNKAIEELILTREVDTITPEEKSFIQYFSGYGGLEKFGASGKGLLYEYFTPSEIAKKMWGLAYKYGFKGGNVLEPSCGIGEFIKYAPEQSMVTGYEINEISAKICRILYPQAIIQSKYFETLFIKNNSSVRNNLQGIKKYELIIGNPPYGNMGGIYAGMGEKSYTKANNYIDYFISRGLDILQKDGLLIFIIGTEVASGGTPFLMQEMNPIKKSIIEKAELVDAYRLPNGVFERTDVLTDIVVFKKK